MSTTIGDPGLTGIPAVSTPATPDDSNVPNRLISASKVEGTAVYNRAGERLGTVEDIMLDKVSGKVAFAVMSFGGFLGMGTSYHPLPWKALTYDTSKGGYVVDIDQDKLRNAPSYTSSESANWSDPSYGRRIDDYYGYGI